MTDFAIDDGRLIEVSWTAPARFAELFDRHYRAVHGFCSRRIGRDDADDIAGETFCRAFEHRRLYDTSRPNAAPWLYGIAANLIRMQHRSRFRAAGAYERAANIGLVVTDLSGAAASALDARRDLAIVAAALPELPADEVDGLLMHVWEGLGYEEIAQAFDVPVGTVRSRIHRVRQRLQAVLAADRATTASSAPESERPKEIRTTERDRSAS